MIEALFWDNDGVLVDTEHLYFEATRDAVAKLGVELTLELHKDLNLRQGRSVFDLARDRGVDSAEINRVRAARDERYSERLALGVELVAGVADTLESLHGKWPMAVVTSCQAHNFEMMHEGLGVRGFFDFVITPSDYARYKPHPEPYLTAAARLELEPARCVVIEDSERGLRAATSAGMRCIAIPNELTAGGDFGDAHAVLEDVRGVPAALVALSAR